MDVCGFPKNNYYYYQSWWGNKDVLHICPHWNWKSKEGEIIDVWCNSNCQTVELFLNGKSLGRKTMDRYSHLEWKVPYQPGVLEARGIRDGRKLTAEIETTGLPSSIILTPDRNRINGDGEDVSVVNVSVSDEKGREVADAGNLINFELKGNGRIIGVGNGDPSSHEADKCQAGKYQRRLFNGKCQLIVQSGTGAGTIEVIASSAGLTPGNALIQAGTCTPRPGVESIK